MCDLLLLSGEEKVLAIQQLNNSITGFPRQGNLDEETKVTKITISPRQNEGIHIFFEVELRWYDLNDYYC